MFLRRARGAAALLLAAAGVALTAATLLAALTVYSRAVTEASVRAAVASADPAERSVLVRGSAGSDPAGQREWDASLRRAFGAGLGGVPVAIDGAEYGAGWALAEPGGAVRPDASGVAYASVLHVGDLAGHARLTAGRWAVAGSSPVQVTLAEPVARLLGRGVGDRIRLGDRRAGRVTEVVVAGVWQPVDAGEPYWRLVPDVAAGVRPGSATYGPLVVDRADFAARFATSASAAWLVTPRLAGATLDEVSRAAGAAAAAGTGLPPPRGLDQSASAETGLSELAARLTRADLVGRSALVTPALLIIVLAGYTLLLMAVLLAEDRRGETALLRARGASGARLAWFAVREALLVVLPAVVLGPVLAVGLVALAGRAPGLASVLDLRPRLAGSAWLVAAVAAAGCALAVAGPAARRGRAYAAEMAARSRPRTRSAVLRVGLDVVLVVLAVLSWVQLRQYSSPLSAAGRGGALGIDPLLAAAPTLGVVAGAVLTLRVLPPLARLAAWLAERTGDSAAVMGSWQAGRRSHAGPMVLVALAVAAGTVSWCLAGTSERSAADQADLRVGADLRVVEVAGVAPVERSAGLVAAPGVAEVLPGARSKVSLGAGGASGELVAVDAEAGSRVLLIRDDVAGGDPARLWRRLARARPAAAGAGVPRRGVVTAGPGVRTTVVVADASGGQVRIPVEPDSAGRFTVTPPAGAGWRLAGFLVAAPAAAPGSTVAWRLDGLDVAPAGSDWQVADREFTGPAVRPRPDAVTATYSVPPSGRVDFAVVPVAAAVPVPVAVTPGALAGLRLRVGQSTSLAVEGALVEVTVVATVTAVPGTDGGPALLADLPSLNAQLLSRRGVVSAPQEWWVATRPGEHAAAAGAVARLPGVRVVDRWAPAAGGGDAFGVGARGALFGAALAAVLLAAAGVAVDVQATARRRAGELTVLHALGAGPRLLIRSLVVEQGFLAGVGALAGLFTGVLVAVAVAPLLVLTPAAGRPVPAALPDVAWLRVAGTGVLLVVVAVALTVLAGVGLHRRLAAVPVTVGRER